MAKTTRPRGFAPWSPAQNTLQLISDVQDILDDNRDILPLTLRQIFYMLVSNYDFEKTERAYKRLCENMNRARRAKMIDMRSVRDDGLKKLSNEGWDSAQHLIDFFKGQAEHFELDRQANQPVKVMVWCEAAGMAPQLSGAADSYHVPVLSSGGFDSVTTKHSMAQEIADHNQVEILHIGDHDPSGVHLYYSLDEDLQAFVDHYGGSVAVTRLAVTVEQVEEMSLPTAPPKRTDNRSFEGETTQAEAIPPRVLREIVVEAIKERVDSGLYQETLDEERTIRERLSDTLSGMDFGGEDE